MNLTVDNVSYSYRNSNTKVVKNASRVFEPGRIYAIMGPSGSGKSTFLSMLAGLDTPTEGDIRYGDTSLKEMDLDRYRREDVSMIFQAFQLFPLLTVVENVCYPMELAGMGTKRSRPKAEEFLMRVGITQDKLKRFPSNLSGGEQQRVAIARSLASGARILLADEPTGNLDLENSKIIMEILSMLTREENYCVIVVTHDVDVSAKADVMYRMTDGIISMSND